MLLGARPPKMEEMDVMSDAGTSACMNAMQVRVCACVCPLGVCVLVRVCVSVCVE